MSKIKMLPVRAMGGTAEYSRSSYHVVVDNDVTADDILTPGFWGNHSQNLKPHALIDLVRENLTLDMQVRVISVGKGFANVRVLRHWEDEETAKEMAASVQAIADDNEAHDDAPIPEEYKITQSPRGGFAVTYLPTSDKIAAGLKLRRDAVAVVREHSKKVGLVPA